MVFSCSFLVYEGGSTDSIYIARCGIAHHLDYPRGRPETLKVCQGIYFLCGRVVRHLPDCHSKSMQQLLKLLHIHRMATSEIILFLLAKL